MQSQGRVERTGGATAVADVDILDVALAAVCESVQLTQPQYSQAVAAYKALEVWLRGDEVFGRHTVEVYPQGSLALQTTVRPLRSEQYDLDVVFRLGVDPKTINPAVGLLNSLHNRLAKHDDYKTRLRRKDRCVRIEFGADRFHLDIIPACQDAQAAAKFIMVPDRKTQDWDRSNPKGFIEWFHARRVMMKAIRIDGIVGGVEPEPLPAQVPAHELSTLQKVVQLAKRHRDVAFAEKPELAPVSILLTTLAATYFDGETNLNRAMGETLARIATSLPTGKAPEIHHPANPGQVISERWHTTPEAYPAFRAWLESFRRAWAALPTPDGIPALRNRLTQLFHQQAAEHAVKKIATVMETARSETQLAVAPATGRLVTSQAAAAVIPVARNTFYGAKK